LKRHAEARDVLESCIGAGIVTCHLLGYQFRLGDLHFAEFLTALETVEQRRCDGFLGFLKLDSYLFSGMQLLRSSFYCNLYRERIQSLLDSFTKLFPEYIPFRFLRALFLRRIRSLLEARVIFEGIMQSAWIFEIGDCLVSLADIYFSMGDTDRALSLLDEAGVRAPGILQTSDYVLVRAKIDPAAISKLSTLYDQDLPVLFDLIRVAIDLEQFTLASQIVAKVKALDITTEEKAWISLYEALICASSGDFEQAKVLTDAVRHSKILVDDATRTHAEIAFSFRKDAAQAMLLLKNLSQKRPTTQTLQMLGEYCRRMGEYDEARVAYESLCALTPDLFNNHCLFRILKDGHFLSDLSVFRSRRVLPEVTEAMIELKQFDIAKITINRQLIDAEPIESAIFLGQLGHIHVLQGRHSEGISVLEPALTIFDQNVAPGDQNSIVKTLRQITSGICLDLGRCFLALSARDKAIDFFESAIVRDKHSPAPVLELVQLYNTRDTKRCSAVCAQFMVDNPMNEEIALIYSEYSFKMFLEVYNSLRIIAIQFPQNTRVLLRMIEIGARAGKLREIRIFFRSYHRQSPSFQIAKALYLVYSGKWRKALKYFSEASRFARWRIFSEHHMMAIYLNPDHKFFYDTEPLADSSSLANAARLLKAMQLNDIERRILTAEMHLSIRTVKSITHAIDIFHSVVQEEPQNLRGSLGLAKAFFLSNRFDEARGFLTPLLAVTPTMHTFAILEEAALLMSQLVSDEEQIQFVDRALDMNRSCWMAWELRARHFMAIKKYTEAVFAFAQFWRLSKRTRPDLGYDYAYSCKKIDRNADAIAVCRDVFSKSPNYRDMRERILIPCYRRIWGAHFPRGHK
jgi:tetratricopeptide (TPR) repeat protein